MKTKLINLPDPIEYLKSFRKDNGLSRGSLASLLTSRQYKVSPEMVREWERGRVKIPATIYIKLLEML